MKENNKKMKKLVLMMALMMSMAFVSCGKGASTDVNDTTKVDTVDTAVQLLDTCVVDTVNI